MERCPNLARDVPEGSGEKCPCPPTVWRHTGGFGTFAPPHPNEPAAGHTSSEVRYEGKGVSATDCSPPTWPSRGMCGSCSAPLKPHRGRVGAEEARVGHGKSSSQAPPLLLAMGIEGKHFQSSDKNTSLAVSAGLRAEPVGSGLVAHLH